MEGIKDGDDFLRVRFGEMSPVTAMRRQRHSKEGIFVCPKRIFLIGEDGTIPKQPCPVDHKTKEGKCSNCGEILDD